MADPAEPPEPWFLVFAVRPDQHDTEVFGDEPFKVTAGEDDLPGVDVPVLALEQRLGDFAFPEFRVREPQITGMPSGVIIR